MRLKISNSLLHFKRLPVDSYVTLKHFLRPAGGFHIRPAPRTGSCLAYVKEAHPHMGKQPVIDLFDEENNPQPNPSGPCRPGSIEQQLDMCEKSGPRGDE